MGKIDMKHSWRAATVWRGVATAILGAGVITAAITCGIAAYLGSTAPAWADAKPPSGTKPASDAKPAPDAGRWLEPVKVTGKIDGKSVTAAMLIYVPRGYPAQSAPGGGSAAPPVAGDKKYPLVIALHGWNHSPELFRDKGELPRWADTYGVVLAVPAMGTTIYETALYPESKRAWAAVPGTRWVGEVILPYVRSHYAVWGDRAHTAVIGYSTGGRGAVLLAEAYPEFAFAGSASGTFDLMRLDPKIGEYKIHAVVLGPRDKFKDRWELDNCTSPARLAKLAGTQLFIAHSSQDKSVPPDQLDALRDALKGNADVKAEFVMAPDGGHTWEYWNGQWGAMFGALAKALGLSPAK
jgi:S-formylglutathione hydrolase FrmB